MINKTEPTSESPRKKVVIIGLCSVAILTGAYFAIFSGSPAAPTVAPQSAANAQKLSDDVMKTSVPIDTKPPDPAERGSRRKSVKP